jgi:hypothetical protein
LAFFIKAGSIPPWQTEAHGQNVTVIDVLAGAAARYAEGGYFVLVDGIIGPWFLDAFRNLGVALHYIVLRPEEAQTMPRTRRGSPFRSCCNFCPAPAVWELGRIGKLLAVGGRPER